LKKSREITVERNLRITTNEELSRGLENKTKGDKADRKKQNP